MLLTAGAAHASDAIYWTSGDALATAGLTGSAPAALANLPSADTGSPHGLALDPAIGKLFFDNYSSDTIYQANLDGTGATQLSTGSATIEGPEGLALDAATDTLYWANHDGGIGEENLTTGAAGNLDITGSADHKEVLGLAYDPVTNKLYWTSPDDNSIDEANPDGSDSAELNVGTAPVTFPYGLAVDEATGTIYWTNWQVAGSMGEASLAGGGAAVSLPSADLDRPAGLAIDPAAGKLYWAEDGSNELLSANVDGSSPAPLVPSSSGTTTGIGFPALLETPLGSGAPTISGTPAVGSPLTCSQGSWAGDLSASFLFLAPSTFSYAWTLFGANAVATSATFTPSLAGSYTCTVTASNFAGATAQTSAAVAVSTNVGPGQGIVTPAPSNAFSIVSLTAPKSATVSVVVHTAGPGEVLASATFTRTIKTTVGHGPHKHTMTRHEPTSYGSAKGAVGASDEGTLTIVPSSSAKRTLAAKRTLHLTVAITFIPTGGTAKRTSGILTVHAPDKPAAKKHKRR
ncbi:MAG TPA: hypothetical protein VHX88_04700 [Solirubrobacteraceae bacterium]|nr:hypothetical protein [Solirubrobacteraceae bacterium]